MIISPKYKFVFIANPKTGCTSIFDTLKNIKDDNKIVGDIAPKNPNNYLYSKHTSCPELQDNHPEFDDYYKFAFVRNPWHRVLSWYFFCQQVDRSPRRNTSNISFKDFINKKRFKNEVWANNNQFQYEFTKNCNFIGKTENLQSDFNVVCDRIGIPHQELPYINKTTHKHYIEYYDDETKQIVAEVFAKDIEHFEYKFEK